MPEDEEEKKKTEADKEKFGGLCKVSFFLWVCLANIAKKVFLDLSLCR